MPKLSGQLQTYQITGKPLDLSEVITLISRTDTPFFYHIGTGETATQTLHSWTTDSLSAPGDNAQVEGFEVGEFQASNVVELNNTTQIFAKAISVSRSAQGIKQAGVTKQYARQMSLRLKEAKQDVEFALIGNSVNVPGTSNTPRRMRGLAAWMKTNVNLGSGGAVATQSDPAVPGTPRALTKDMIREIMQKTWENGGKSTIMMAAPSVRGQITDILKLVNVQHEEAKEKHVTDTVSIYLSDFGTLKVIPNCVQAGVPYSKDCLFILDTQRWKKSYLTNGHWREEKLAKTGDSDKGYIVCELTLEARAEESSGMIADILN